MTRIIAVVVAIGLIVGAVLTRRALDDDGADEPSGSGDDTIELVCAIELRDACKTLDGRNGVRVTIEDAANTAATLASIPTDVDLWAVPAPWPAMVDDQRSRAGLDPLFADVAAPVARSPLAAVAPDDLGDCGWRCLGDRAGDDLDLGGPSPSSGLGALQLGAFAVGWFGSTDFATNDFDPAFTSWLGGVVDAIAVTDEPVTRLLQSRAFFDVALSFDADAAADLDAASEDRSAGLALLYPAPVAYLDALVAGVDGRLSGDAADVAADLGRGLIDEGWLAPSSDPNGLPRAGVLLALQDLL